MLKWNPLYIVNNFQKLRLTHSITTELTEKNVCEQKAQRENNDELHFQVHHLNCSSTICTFFKHTANLTVGKMLQFFIHHTNINAKSCDMCVRKWMHYIIKKREQTQRNCKQLLEECNFKFFFSYLYNFFNVFLHVKRLPESLLIFDIKVKGIVKVLFKKKEALQCRCLRGIFENLARNHIKQH